MPVRRKLASSKCATSGSGQFSGYITLPNSFGSPNKANLTAAHFPDLNFNQLVMKAIFIEAPVARIEGLAARRNADLARMARDYASERRAASRTVPPELALVLGESALT